MFCNMNCQIDTVLHLTEAFCVNSPPPSLITEGPERDMPFLAPINYK